MDVSKDQWLVLGLLLILLVLEVVIHPTFKKELLDFLKNFAPPKTNTSNFNTNQAQTTNKSITLL